MELVGILLMTLHNSVNIRFSCFTLQLLLCVQWCVVSRSTEYDRQHWNPIYWGESSLWMGWCVPTVFIPYTMFRSSKYNGHWTPLPPAQHNSRSSLRI